MDCHRAAIFGGLADPGDIEWNADWRRPGQLGRYPALNVSWSLNFIEFDLRRKSANNKHVVHSYWLALEIFMDPTLFSSLGLLFTGIITTALIYWFGARRVLGTSEYAAAFRWTLAFALFICTFLGAAPVLVEQALWLLLLPFSGIALSLLSIQRIVLLANITKENHQAAAGAN